MENNDAGYTPPTPWVTPTPVPTVTPGTIQPSPPPQALADTGFEVTNGMVLAMILVILGMFIVRILKKD